MGLPLLNLRRYLSGKADVRKTPVAGVPAYLVEAELRRT